jgi:hypothetical protein
MTLRDQNGFQVILADPMPMSPRTFEQFRLSCLLGFRRECRAQMIPADEVENLTYSLDARLDRLKDELGVNR